MAVRAVYEILSALFARLADLHKETMRYLSETNGRMHNIHAQIEQRVRLIRLVGSSQRQLV